MKSLNIDANRKARKWSCVELAGRASWEMLGSLLFMLSPRQIWGWRNSLLRVFGAKIGKEVRIHPTVRIDVPWNIEIGNYTAVGDRVVLYALGKIRIGDKVTISQYAHLCAGSHDHRSPTMQLTKPPITIGSGAWICAGAYIGPDVTVGDGAIVGAYAVVAKNVAVCSVVVGNPAREVDKSNDAI